MVQVNKEALVTIQKNSEPEREASKTENGTSEPKSDSHPFQCLICDARFKLKKTLDNHNNIHSGSKPHKCSQCPRSFAQKVCLTRHEEVHDKDKERSFICPVCDAPFSRQEQLDLHSKGHQKKSLSCSICGVEFSTPRYLARHIGRSHPEERDFPCSQCDLSFSRRMNANRHMQKVHKILTPYSCSSCSQSFRLKKELLAHEATHKNNGQNNNNNNNNNKIKSSSSSSKTKTKSSANTNTIKMNNEVLNHESDTEQIDSEDEKLIDEKQNPAVSQKVGVDDDENMVIENEPPVKKMRIEDIPVEIVPAKNDNENKENEEEQECEFFTSNPYWCFCGQFFSSKELFTHHQDNEESGKHFLQLHECPSCPETGPEIFETFEEFEDHYSSFHQLLIHECPLCGDEYATIQELEDHLDQVDPSLFLK